MTSIEEIRDAIRALPPEEVASLCAWLEEYDAANWDKEFEEGVRSGRLDVLAKEAVADYRQGKCKEL